MANGNREDAQNRYGKIVAKAWTDEAFKARLMSDPKSIFKENGIDVPEDVEVKVVENTDKLIHFSLPPKPEEGDLSDEELEKIAAGCSAGIIKIDNPLDIGCCEPH